MQIEEIGADKKTNGIRGASRQSELRRQAQTMAAEQLASVQAANAGGQTVSSKAELQDDAVNLSSKALSQVTARNSTDSLNRRDDLMSSLMEKLNTEILNPDSEFNKQNEKKKAGKGQGQGGQKKKQVEQKTEWEPETKEGQIHPGRDVIGKVRVTKEVKETGGEGGSGAVGGVGQSGGSKSNSKSGTPNYGKAAESKGSPNQQAGQIGKDSKDQDKEAKEVSAAKSLEKSGLKAQGLEQQGKAGKSKTEEQSGEAGAAGAGGTKEFEVRTRATGTSQSLTVTPPKKLQKGEGFRTFRKLDDKPMLKYATMHKKEFQGGDNKEAIKELKKNARAAGESPEAIQQAVQKLKDRTSPDQ